MIALSLVHACGGGGGGGGEGGGNKADINFISDNCSLLVAN